MSKLFDDASLAMIPSAYKDGKLYSIRPTDGDGDFTFSRGSNLAATRVDVNGLIEKGRENLLLQSNSFDTTWGNTNSTDTSGQAGYDGSNNAWLIQSTNTDGRIEQSTSYGSGVRTFSVYAKAGTGGLLRLRMQGGANAYADFDLDNGVVDFTDNDIIQSKITSAGNGWYRCSINTNDTNTKVYIYVMGASGLNLYIQDAQLEAGLVATDYIETTSSTAQAGILEDTPRLDYSGGASCPALLLEPQRSNLVTSSEYIDGGAAWSLPNIIVEDNSIISPEGLQNASKLTSTADFAKIYQQINLSASTTYTASFWVKDISSGSSLRANLFDLTNGTPLLNENYSEDISTTEWKRLEFQFTTTTACTLQAQFVRDLNDGEEIYVWGFQIEAGSYPTSYIPTYGASVTRSQDNMTTDFSSALATNGSATIFFHDLGVADSDDISSAGGLYRYEGSSGNYVSLTTETTNWRVRVQGGGSSNFYGLSGYAKTSPIKVAIVVTSTTYSIYANGSVVIENQSLTTTADFSSIDRFQSGIQEVSGVRKALQHAVFPTALTSSEAIALTTL